MTTRCSVKFCIVLCLLRVCVADLEVKNKAYQGVRVTFSSNILPENATKSVESVKQLLRDTSDALHKAIGLRIGSVTFRIPQTWDQSAFENVLPTAKWVGSSDVQVDGRTIGPPYAAQYGGCGVPGRGVVLPVGWLENEEEESKGKFFAREWMKNLYGVFDENGFEDDPLYPLHYRIPGTTELRITDCTDTQVTYSFKNSSGDECSPEMPDPSTGQCDAYPDDESAANVTSSLLYFHPKMVNMETICGDETHPHNDASPNKHNLMCNGESIRQVLHRFKEFQTQEETSEGIEENKDIVYTYVSDPKPRIIYAWQNTVHLKDKQPLIFYGAHRLMYELPLGSRCGMYHFAHTEEEGYDPEDWVRIFSELVDKNVALSSDFAVPHEPCVTCFLRMAVEVMLKDDTDAEGSIILIAASNPKPDVELEAKLKSHSNIHLTVLGAGEATAEGFSSFLPDPEQFHRLNSSTGPEPDPETDLHNFKALIEALELERNNAPSPTDQMTETIEISILSYDKPMLIPANSMAQSFTLWPSDTIQLKNIHCTSLASDTNVQLQPPVQGYILSFTFTAVESEVSCKLAYENIKPRPTEIQMITKPGEYITLDLWTRDTTNPTDQQIQMPVILYARVYFGKLPVRDAFVVAQFKGKSDLLELFDDGRGDPDITQYDGIYSRYFTQFTDKGTYEMEVFATFEENTAFGTNGLGRCCGSIVQGGSSSLPPFNISTSTLFEVKGERPKGGYPPNKITDLRVTVYEPPTHLNLTWTAPGAEMDSGRAHSYILETSETRAALNNFSNSAAAPVEVTIRPRPYGEHETLVVDMKELQDDKTHYLTLRATNNNGKTGDISNILEVFIPKDDRTTDTTTTSILDIKEQTGGLDKKTIGIIIGVLMAVILVAILVYMAVYFFVIRPKNKKAAKTKSDTETRSRNGDVSNPISLNSIPADVILKHHNEVVSAKKDHRKPPIFKAEDIEKSNPAAEVLDVPNEPDLPEGRDGVEYSEEQRRGEVEARQEGLPSKSPKRITRV